MSEHHESLLHKIKRLYTEIFLVSLHNRIDSYHALLHSEKHHEIGSVLHRIIDEIVEEVSRNYTRQDYQNLKFLEEDPSARYKNLDRFQNYSSNMVSMTMNGLSVYLQKKKVEEHDPHMSGRLQRVVWDHVHSAHRFARLGDGNTAKLHADIATNAMKALCHYMPAEDYHDFYDEIHQQLTEDTTTQPLQ
jgi:hypothetical protein